MNLNGASIRWLRYRLGLVGADTQTTPAERGCLERHAAGRHAIVELGVMHGATTALLRRVMAGDGSVTGIDPHPPGRLRVSFERWVALREVSKCPRGTATLVRDTSHGAAAGWRTPIDFLFIDADHSWSAIARDWADWTPHVIDGGLVALHDSRSVPGRPDADSVRFMREVVAHDTRFRIVDEVDSLTVLRRLG